MEDMIVYKVASRKEETAIDQPVEYVSFLYNHPSDEGMSVKYESGHTSRPKIEGTPLFAFESLKPAIRFCQNSLYDRKDDLPPPIEYGHVAIYKAKATPWMPELDIKLEDIQLHYHFDEAWAADFWESVIEGNPPEASRSPVEGTVLCESITCIRRLDTREIALALQEETDGEENLP